jgi:pilus assembly protein Flp/PilA
MGRNGSQASGRPAETGLQLNKYQGFFPNLTLLDPGHGKSRVTEYCNRRQIMKFINKLLRNEAGATAIEYGLIAALIAVAAITAMRGMGSQLRSTFSTTSGALSTANASAG